MKLFLVFSLVFVIAFITETHCEEGKELVFKYDGMEQQESMQNYFDIAMENIKRKEGSDSIFLVNGNFEQKLDLDDDWKAQIIVYRSDTVDGEYAEYIKFPALGACAFMKTVYKKYFYPIMKECSNLPAPETCPISKEKYHANCEFNANVYRKVSQPGFYKIQTDLLHSGEIKTGVVMKVSVFEK